MKCKNCGCKRSRVTNTWTREIRWRGVTKYRVRRRRVCTHCGIPFFTIEDEEEETSPKEETGESPPDTPTPRPSNGKLPPNPFI